VYDRDHHLKGAEFVPDLVVREGYQRSGVGFSILMSVPEPPEPEQTITQFLATESSVSYHTQIYGPYRHHQTYQLFGRDPLMLGKEASKL
jgi:hypothetical protein